MSPQARLPFDLAANLGWPWLVLTFGSGDDALGPRWGPAVAMMAPLGFALWRRVSEGRTSALSVLVILSLLVNAGVGFVPLSAVWFAVKEAVVPAVFAAVFALSTLWGPGIVAELVRDLADPDAVERALKERGTEGEYLAAMRRGTRRFAAVFAVSGLVGGALAAFMVQSPTGTTEFAAELGRYTLWSYGVVNAPMILGTVWVLRDVVEGLERCTGLRLGGE